MTKKILSTFLLAIGVTFSQAQIITTIAGNGTPTYSGISGPATATTIFEPVGVTLDAAGNIYFINNNNYVSKINKSGIISLFAGAGPGGPLGDGGPATAASLQALRGLGVDGAGNVYISDAGHDRIRKVDASGIITTCAGGGSSYADGVAATTASLGNMAFQIAFDAAGNMYIADGVYVRKVSSSGIITHIAGNGTSSYSGGDGTPATSVSFIGAFGIVVDPANNVYFSDYKNNLIRKVDASGIISTVAGNGSTTGSFGGDNGPATAGMLNQPSELCFDVMSNLYISDVSNSRIRKIDHSTNVITTITGDGGAGSSGDGGLATAARVNNPHGVYVDCAYNVFIGDYLGMRVRKITYDHGPKYTGANNSIMLCGNTTASVDTLLHTDDSWTGETLPWNVDTLPKHGTIAGSGYSTITTGSTLMPAGITYTPSYGYSGPDSFAIVAGGCPQSADRRMIYVTVLPVPAVAATTGASSVCKGSTVTLSNTTPGGIWSSSAGSVAIVSSGTVTGVVPGTAIINYTITGVNGCTSTATYSMTVNLCAVRVNEVPGDIPLVVYPNPVNDVLHVDGVQNALSYRLVGMMGNVLLEGTLSNSNNNIPVKALAKGVYMIEVCDTATGTKKINRIIKD